MPDLPPSQVRMLGVVALALLFENYDQATLTAALKQIADTFAVQESDVGSLLGYIHMGAIPALFVIPLADRIGRRRLFLVSIVALGLATVASAFAQTMVQFIVLQMVGRTFMVTTAATAYVIVAEEFPAAHRGWGVGILGALGSMGFGLSLILFAAIDFLPYGWRALYIIGFAPIALLPMFRRELSETRRFQAQSDDPSGPRSAVGNWFRPVGQLLRELPGRATAIGFIGAASSAGHAVGFNFSAYFVQQEHGWSPGQYALMAVAAGLVGIIGHPYVGRLADRYGRRGVGFTVFAAYPLLVYAFYHGPGWTLPLLWIPLIFALTGGGTIQRALAAELFPTAYRTTASGWLLMAEAAGRSVGFFLVDWGTPDGGSNTLMITLVALLCLPAGATVLLLPESSRRELEDISGPTPGPGGG
jgi:MFS family permease